MMAAILNSAIRGFRHCHLGLAILNKKPCYLLSDCSSKTIFLHSDFDKLIQLIHSFWINLMMAPILNSAIMDSAILQKNSQTHSFWLTKIWFPLSAQKNSLIDSLNLMMAAILNQLPCWIQTLPSWIQTPCYLLSDSLKNTLPPLWLWLKLIQSD